MPPSLASLTNITPSDSSIEIEGNQMAYFERVGFPAYLAKYESCPETPLANTTGALHMVGMK
jgi:hypothetical protein